MSRISDIPLFDAADYLETPQDCANFLLDLIHDGSDEDVRRGFAAVARATGRPVGDLSGGVLDNVRDGRSDQAVAVLAVMERLGIGTGPRPVSPA